MQKQLLFQKVNYLTPNTQVVLSITIELEPKVYIYFTYALLSRSTELLKALEQTWRPIGERKEFFLKL